MLIDLLYLEMYNQNKLFRSIDQNGAYEAMLNEIQIVDNAFDFIKRIFSEDYSGHDYYHSIRVYNNAINIALIEGGNLFLIKLAALLHDIDDRKLFNTSDNLDHAQAFLKDNCVDEDSIFKICKIIKSVSFKGGESVVPDSIEGKIVQDADRLDALGAIGIARTFAYGGHKGRPIYEPCEKPIEEMTAKEYENHTSSSINHFYEKLLKLKDLMNTETAKSLAEKRHAFIENYLDEFISEWNGVQFMNYTIREMKPSEYPILDDFLYEAIFQRDETNLLPRSIIKKPELQLYIQNFGKEKDDFCFCAEKDGKIIGAVWVRNMNGYGSIDDVSPEFAISLYKDYRGYGIGTVLMKKMLQHLKSAGYSKASLAVQKDNYAYKMYLSVGFQIISENQEEYIMTYSL